MNVLVVDDVPLNRAVLRRAFQAAGAAVVEAADGQAAVDAFAAGRGAATFCLVMMDLQMPVDGWTATARIRALESVAGWQQVPVIACSTEDLSPGSANLQRCWDSGMTAVMGKAVSKATAEQLLERWAGWAPSCSSSSRNSEDGSTCAFAAQAGGSSAFSAGSMAAPFGVSAAASAPTSPRSSMDSETSCLNDCVRQALSSRLYSW